MPSILSQLLNNEKFIENLADACESYQINKTRQAYDESKDGVIEDGIITAFNISSDFTFGDIDSNPEGLIMSITVNFTADAIVEFVNSEGTTDNNTPSSDCTADVSITLPDDTIALDNIDDIAYKTEIEILDIKDELDTKSPDEILQKEKESRAVDLHSMSEEELLKEVEKLDKENNSLKRQITKLNNQVAGLNKRITELGSSNRL